MNSLTESAEDSIPCPGCRAALLVDSDASSGDIACQACQKLFWLPAILAEEDFSFLAGGGQWFEIRADSVEEAVDLLMQKLVELSGFSSELADELKAAILKRESLGSTGMGEGVAIPHAKHKSLGQFAGILGRAPEGVDFQSPDGELVTDIFLLLSPSQRTGDHLRNLERISRCSRPAATR